MQRIAGDAGALYAEGVGPQYYPGQTWVDFNPYQVEAQRLIGETAVSNDLSPRAFETAAGIMDYGGVSREGFDAVAPVQDIAAGARRIGTEDHYLDWLSTQNPGLTADTRGAVLQSISPVQNVASGANQITTGGMFGNVYSNAGQPSASSGFLGGLAQGAGGPSAASTFLGGVAAGGGPTAADTFLGGMASGPQGIDPNLQLMLDDNAERIGNQVASKLSGSGRYGQNAAFADLLGRNIAAANAPIVFQANEAARQRQLAATGQIDAARNARIAQQLGAAGQIDTSRLGLGQHQIGAAGQIDQSRLGLGGQQLSAAQGATGVEQQNLANQIGAGQYLGNLFQTAQNQRFGQGLAGLREWGNAQASNIQNEMGAGLNLANFYQGAQDDAFRAALAAPALAASRYADWDRLLDLGGQIEARDAAILKDAIDRFEFQNQMPWNQLGMYGQQLQGVNAGQTQTQIAERPQAPLGQRLLGGAAGGAALGSIFGAPGALFGGLGGGLLGLWG